MTNGRYISSQEDSNLSTASGDDNHLIPRLETYISQLLRAIPENNRLIPFQFHEEAVTRRQLRHVLVNS